MARKYGQVFVVGRRCFGGNAERRQTNIRFKQRNSGKWSRIGNQGSHGHDQEKLRFLRRRLLYFPQGTESFNPVMIQIILSADVHPHPGPYSKQKRNSRPQQDTKENHSTASAVGQRATSKFIVPLGTDNVRRQISELKGYCSFIASYITVM